MWVSYIFDADEPLRSAWSYRWDGGGRLILVVRPDGERVRFTYDALGRRLTKSFQGALTSWVWDGNRPLHEWRQEGLKREEPVNIFRHRYKLDVFGRPSDRERGWERGWER